MTDKHIKIGFANLDDQNPYALELRQSLEAAADANPAVELIIRDNAMDNDRARENINAFLEAKVDVVIMFHINQRISQQLLFPLNLNYIPVIAVDLPIPGTYYFGVDNTEAGTIAGAALVAWINENWAGQLDRLICLTEYQVLDFTRQRFSTVLYTLVENFPIHPERDVLYIDNGSSTQAAKERFARLLQHWQHKHLAVVCINDNTALGVIEAVREQNRHADVAIVSYDGTKLAAEAFAAHDVNFVASPYISQRESGPHLLNLCLKLATGQPAPRNTFLPIVPLSWKNYEQLQSGSS